MQSALGVQAYRQGRIIQVIALRRDVRTVEWVGGDHPQVRMLRDPLAVAGRAGVAQHRGDPVREVLPVISAPVGGDIHGQVHRGLVRQGDEVPAQEQEAGGLAAQVTLAAQKEVVVIADQRLAGAVERVARQVQGRAAQCEEVGQGAGGALGPGGQGLRAGLGTAPGTRCRASDLPRPVHGGFLRRFDAQDT